MSHTHKVKSGFELLGPRGTEPQASEGLLTCLLVSIFYLSLSLRAPGQTPERPREGCQCMSWQS